MSLNGIAADATRYLKTDARHLTAPEIYESAVSSLIEHSLNRPHLVCVDAVSDGQKRQHFPPQYETGFSKVIQIEHPVDNVPPSFRDKSSWMSVDTPHGARIGFISPPALGQAYRLHFTRKHRSPVALAISDINIHDANSAKITFPVRHLLEVGDVITINGSDSIPLIDGSRMVANIINEHAIMIDFPITGAGTTGIVTTTTAQTTSSQEDEALGFLAASKAMMVLASKFAHSAEPNIATGIDYQSKRQEFIEHASSFRKQYILLLSGESKAAKSSSGFVMASMGLPLERRMALKRWRT